MIKLNEWEQRKAAKSADEIDLTLPPELDRRLNGVDTEPADRDFPPEPAECLPPEVGGAAPPTQDEDEIAIIAEGREALARRAANARTSWRDWVLVGKALRVGHEEAKRKANGKTNGNKYAAAFHAWLKDNRFLDIDKVIDKSDRTKLLWLVNRLPEIEAWRQTKTETELAAWNHPSTCWRIAHCQDRGLPDFKAKKSGAASTTTDDDSAAPLEQQEKETKKKKNNWDPGQLLLAANKAMGLIAPLTPRGKSSWEWSSPEPPDLALVKVWWELAWAVTKIAGFLDGANGHAKDLPLKVRCGKELATSCFLTEEERDERPPIS